MKLRIGLLRRDGGTQTREALNLATVADYAESMRAGAAFPPVIVFLDGETYWLADGFHRVEAALSVPVEEIDCTVKQGTRRDAILYSVGSNSTHGLRRTNEDKRRAVNVLLGDEEWSKWSDRVIAERCGVGNKFVGDMRRGSSVSGTQIERTVVRNGTEYTQNTAAIGKSKPAAPAPPPATRWAADLPVTSAPTENDDDSEEDEEDPAPEYVEVDDTDVPPPVVVRSEKERGWGDFDVSLKVNAIIRATRAYRAELVALFADVDPRFDAEVRQRAEGVLLEVTKEIFDRLPPDARKAEQTRAKFRVLDGGK